MFADFFGYQNEGYTFQYYGISHITPIIILFLSLIVLYLFRNKLRDYKHEANIRYIIGSIIILTQMAYTYNNIYIGETIGRQFATITKDLPLSLCGASMILTGLLMYNKSHKLFSILYFWVLIGATLAILLPSAIANNDYGHYGPDKFRYYQFWIGHIGIVLIIFYMIFVHKYRITFKSLLYSFKWLTILTIIVIFVNHSIGSNYLFLQDPSKTGLGFFPNYPYSVIVFGVLGIILYLIAYLPWYYRNKTN